MDRRARGQQIEQLAAAYLQQQGLLIKQSNYHTRQGEIDLIAAEPGVIVFVEVRYRKHSAYGTGAESVTAAKQQKLRLAAMKYLQQHQLDNADCRFDVISASGDPVQFEWIRNAF